MPSLTTLELLAFIHTLGFQKDFQRKEVFQAYKQRNHSCVQVPSRVAARGLNHMICAQRGAGGSGPPSWPGLAFCPSFPGLGPMTPSAHTR